MTSHEKDYQEQSAQFWERFRLYNENERGEKTKEVHRWAVIHYAPGQSILFLLPKRLIRGHLAGGLRAARFFILICTYVIYYQ